MKNEKEEILTFDIHIIRFERERERRLKKEEMKKRRKQFFKNEE